MNFGQGLGTYLNSKHQAHLQKLASLGCLQLFLCALKVFWSLDTQHAATQPHGSFFALLEHYAKVISVPVKL